MPGVQADVVVLLLSNKTATVATTEATRIKQRMPISKTIFLQVDGESLSPIRFVSRWEESSVTLTGSGSGLVAFRGFGRVSTDGGSGTNL